jgi:hypothetical protein
MDNQKLDKAIIAQSAIELVHIAQEVAENDSMDWETKYKLIFSKEVSIRLNSLLRQLGMELNYCDPDSGYDDDVRAYIWAVEEKLPALEEQAHVENLVGFEMNRLHCIRVAGF